MKKNFHLNRRFVAFFFLFFLHFTGLTLEGGRGGTFPLSSGHDRAVVYIDKVSVPVMFFSFYLSSIFRVGGGI